MKSLVKAVRKLLAARDGLETVEYAIIVGLIVVGAIGTIVGIGTWVSGKFTALQTGLQGH
jgi:pilus assembly protein Flp/PilA